MFMTSASNWPCYIAMKLLTLSYLATHSIYVMHVSSINIVQARDEVAYRYNYCTNIVVGMLRRPPN